MTDVRITNPKFSQKYTVLFFFGGKEEMQKSGTKREKGQNKCDGKDHKKLSLSLSVRRESESSLGRGELAAQWVRDIAQERGSWVRDRLFSHLLGSGFS